MRALWEASDWVDVAAYIGPNADAFQPTWEKLRAKGLAGKPGLVWGWSWPAFLFGFAWFAYRKQWAMVATLIAFPLVAIYLLPGAGGSFAGVGIVIAMIAKSSYVQIAVTQIDKAKSQGGALDKVAATGGVSVAAGVIAGIVYAGAAGAALAAAFSR